MGEHSTKYKADDLLTPSQVSTVICEIMNCARSQYYALWFKYQKFKYYGVTKKEDGQVKLHMKRIPYDVTVGVGNLLKKRYDAETHPPISEIRKFLNPDLESEFYKLTHHNKSKSV